MARRSYKSKLWVARFKKYTTKRKARNGLDPCAYRAWLKRFKVVATTDSCLRKTKYDKSVYWRVLFNYHAENPHLQFNTKFFGKSAYQAFTRRKVMLTRKIELKFQGRYNAYDAEVERRAIIHATTVADLGEKTTAATNHPNQIKKTARTLFYNTLRESGKLPRYHTWRYGKKLVRKHVPTSNNYFARVESDHKALWSTLEKTIAHNTKQQR